MSFINSLIATSARAAAHNSTNQLLKRQALCNLRNYSSKTQTQVGKNSNTTLLASLIGATGIGGLLYKRQNAAQMASAEQDEKEVPSAFASRGFVSLKLLEVKPVTHNTSIFRFALPEENQKAGLPVASCVLAKYSTGRWIPILRPYTPISTEDTVGYVDFMIKKYDDGKLTPHIHDLKPGDTLDFRGPMKSYDWENEKKAHVGMIAGGVGITPMLQIIRNVFNEKSNDTTTKISLVFANQTEQDILLKDELDAIAKQHPDRFKVVYALDKAPKDWSGISGYVTKDVVEAYLPDPKEEDSVIFVCGPPPMMESIAGNKPFISQGKFGGILKELGYKEKNVYKF